MPLAVNRAELYAAILKEPGNQQALELALQIHVLNGGKEGRITGRRGVQCTVCRREIGSRGRRIVSDRGRRSRGPRRVGCGGGARNTTRRARVNPSSAYRIKAGWFWPWIGGEIGRGGAAFRCGGLTVFWPLIRIGSCHRELSFFWRPIGRQAGCGLDRFRCYGVGLLIPCRTAFTRPRGGRSTRSRGRGRK